MYVPNEGQDETLNTLPDLVLSPDGKLLDRFSGYEPKNVGAYVDRLKEIGSRNEVILPENCPQESDSVRDGTARKEKPL